mgnify:CR=1 FL=1
MKRKTLRERGIGLIKALRCLGVPEHRLDWKLQSGRLNPDIEIRILKYLKASTLKDAIDALIYGRNTFKEVSCQELRDKLWITQKDIDMGESLKEAILK